MSKDEAIKRLMIGDLEKPFHRPECGCTNCEDWRRINKVPTQQELRDIRDAKYS